MHNCVTVTIRLCDQSMWACKKLAVLFSRRSSHCMEATFPQSSKPVLLRGPMKSVCENLIDIQDGLVPLIMFHCFKYGLQIIPLEKYLVH